MRWYQAADGVQMVVPVMQLLGKELTIKASITYSDAAVKETVEAFAAGEFPASGVECE